MDTLPSGVLLIGGFRSALICFQLSLSCPFRLLHTFPSLRPARHYPRFWIRRSSSERRRDFNPHEQRAAQHTLWRGPTPLQRAGPLCGYLPFRAGLGPGWIERFQRSPGSRACCFSACAGSPTTQDRLLARDWRETAVLPSSIRKESASWFCVFRSSIARPTDTPVYASSDISRYRLQDSRPGWIRCSPFL